jgi:Tfp pilus assembly protein PilO
MNTERINSIPWYAKALIFVALGLTIFTGFWFFVTKGTRAETKKLQEEIAVLQKANLEAQIASQRLNEFRLAFKNKQQELDELRALLPEQRELTNVLQGIQERARATSLQLRKFTPKDDIQQDFYSGKKIDVAVQSSFSGLRSFFDQMAKYQRIVSITNFEIKQLDKQAANKTLEARFDLTAYYVSSEKLQKQSAPQGAKPAQGAPAAPQGTQAAPPAPGK